MLQMPPSLGQKPKHEPKIAIASAAAVGESPGEASHREAMQNQLLLSHVQGNA